jgi:hypothetical protein
MADNYRIGVSIALANGVSPVLAIISKDLLGLRGPIGQIERGFAGWHGKLIGVASVLAGGAILGAIKKIADASKDLLDQQDQLRRNGIAWNEVLKLTADGYDRIAKIVPTAPASEILKTERELRAVTGGTDEAVKLTPKALMIDALLSNNAGKEVHGELYKLLRAGEMKGIATDDAKLNEFVDKAFSYIIAFGGKLTADDFTQLARRGGAAFINMKPEAFGPTAVLAADIGGSAAGTAGMTFQNLMTGANTMTKQQGKVWQDLGLLDPSKTTKTGFGGGRLQLGMGALQGSQEYSGNIPGWIHDVVYPAIIKAATHDGVVNQAEVEELIGKLAPNRNANKLIHMYGQPGFQDQTKKDLGLAAQVLPIDQAYQNFINTNPKGVEEAYNAQYKSMMEAIGAPVMQAAMPVMKSVTEMFTALGSFANANPEAIKTIAYTLGGIAAALIAIPIATLLGVPLAVSGIVTAVIALGALEWDRVRGYLLAFNQAMTDFISWLASIADKIRGLFSGGKVEGDFGKNLDDANKNYVPMRFDPGTSKTKATQTAFSLNIDGRTFAQTMIEQMEDITEHAVSAPAYNGQSHFARADSGMATT